MIFFFVYSGQHAAASVLNVQRHQHVQRTIAQSFTVQHFGTPPLRYVIKPVTMVKQTKNILGDAKSYGKLHGKNACLVNGRSSGSNLSVHLFAKLFQIFVDSFLRRSENTLWRNLYISDSLLWMLRRRNYDSVSLVLLFKGCEGQRVGATENNTLG